jgi:RimJ/RimL family protein N-acetyltransferase
MTMSTARLTLTPLHGGHADGIWPYVSDPEISRYMSWNAHESMETTNAFIADVVRRMQEGSTCSWVISERDSENICGLVSLLAITRTHRALRYDKAELAYWIGRPFQRRGYAREACRAVLDYAFGTLTLNKVTVAHDAGNAASAALIHRLGFRQIGVEHQHFCKDGRWIDHVIYEVLRADYNR